ncbi:1-aminocyclopropane-1-carboxylate deaminase/D-cysteine desulfhydrase [Mesonia ostreae]|uniref:Pyridoxal-phosphate dependent enzyme n=1 Tax=Mesonia ostreae TaxID=861110 RepID=A0ABU2KG37_9FLAO|nr:pyridoxal-phosphate dependent enzyme [Mesonia ostreae]MDT0293677.1 pyridoxal-phosphate dependent enzyme [Mesonia ostreae]
MFNLTPSSNQFIIQKNGVEVFLKREDLLHPLVSGNKFRKLKYNLQEAKKQGKDTILTFGGAFSNHIVATSAAAKLSQLKSIGVIRGEELGGENLEKTLLQNHTLRNAKEMGMQLFFVDRETYRNKEKQSFIEALKNKFGDFYLVPEGGTNDLAIKGCEEILTEADKNFDVVCCPVGTGGTVSGIINSSYEQQHILGFSALKGDFLKDEVAQLVKKKNWEIIIDYHFGGYAKVDRTLIDFINDFKTHYNVLLDPIYTGKMIYGIFDRIEKEEFTKNTRILAVHTGGLQGISGVNKKLIKKNLPKINT